MDSPTTVTLSASQRLVQAACVLPSVEFLYRKPAIIDTQIDVHDDAQTPPARSVRSVCAVSMERTAVNVFLVILRSTCDREPQGHQP